MTVHQALEHAWLKGDHSDRTHRIPSSRYDKIRAKIQQRYVSFYRLRTDTLCLNALFIYNYYIQIFRLTMVELL